MKKIGLCIQFENVDNYGTVLQSYATIKAITKFNVNPRLIRYKRCYTIRFILSQFNRVFSFIFFKTWFRDMKRKLATNSSSVFKQYMEEKRIAFGIFRKKYFPENLVDTCIGYDELSLHANNYDAVLVGSDQLWLPQGMRTNFYNLNFVPDNITKISYATSFGVSTIPGDMKKDAMKFLNRIDYLSVREQSGCEIIKNLTQRDAFLACDPVMLLEKDEWKIFSQQSKFLGKYKNESYLFCYFLGGNKEERVAAKKIAKDLGVKLLVIKFVEDYFQIDESFGDIAPSSIGPEDFVYLLSNAKYVITDSFHGTAFSIIFEKQFLVMYRFSNKSVYSKNSRIDNILQKFKLNDRLYLNGDPTLNMQKKINFEKTNKIRNEWKNQSIEFLSKALGDNYVS